MTKAVRLQVLRLIVCPILAGATLTGIRAQESDTSILPVPYQRQQDRTLCQSASVSMFLKYVAEKDLSQEEIRKALIKLGGQYLHSTRVKLLQTQLPGYEIAFRYMTDENVAWKEIGDLLRHNIPVILSTRLTNSGHVVLVIGAAEAKGERRLIVHDPWGRFDFQTRKFDRKGGEKVSYPFGELVNKTRFVRGTGRSGPIRFSEWYNTGTGTWLLDNRRATTEDLRVVGEKAEWRYMRILQVK
jgi:hypothetical protein